MKYVHRIGLSATADQLSELETLGVSPRPAAGTGIPGSQSTFVAFDIEETHPNWERLRSLFEQWKVSDVLRTEFSKREVESAEWVQIAAWHHGYPQPNDEEFGYREATFDLSDWCDKCGIGMKQKGPFQMKKEPRWGRNNAMQLIWVYDELFVSPGIWTQIFQPAGVDRRPVFNTKGSELKTVVQLVLDDICEIDTRGLQGVPCPQCKRIKYPPVTRGPFPSMIGAVKKQMSRTSIFFGSGAHANRRILASQNIVRAISEAQIRGFEFKPVAKH